MLLTNLANFYCNSSVGNSNGQFQWMPILANQRSKPYIEVIRVGEEFGTYIFEKDITYVLNVTSSIGVSEHLNSEIIFTLSPNPTTSQFTITNPTTIDELKITDVFGQLIYHTKPKEKNFSLQLNKEGIYFVTITSGEQMATKKLVVQQ